MAAAVSPLHSSVDARRDNLLELRQRLDERVIGPFDEELRDSDRRQMLTARFLGPSGRMQRIPEVDQPIDAHPLGDRHRRQPPAVGLAGSP